MRLTKLHILLLIGLAYTGITWFIPVVLPADTAFMLIDEDGIIEYVGAFCFFMAAVLFFVLFLKSKTGNDLFIFRTRKNIIYLGLAAILLFGAGEEISWGQRILDFETPDALREINIQEEFTLHNLPLFDTANIDSLLRANRLFIMFWFSFAIMVPVAALLHERLRELIERVNIPITPLLLGAMFPVNYVLSKVYGRIGIDVDSMTEIRETQDAVIFVLIAVWFLLQLRETEKRKNESLTTG
jgi:hypothetical protein